eukprot:Sspe_Gene.77586::Locus_48488_Transcript_1_1_Confidence_1.000_Length_1150::g.77586::m.77586
MAEAQSAVTDKTPTAGDLKDYFLASCMSDILTEEAELDEPVSPLDQLAMHEEETRQLEERLSELVSKFDELHRTEQELIALTNAFPHSRSSLHLNCEPSEAHPDEEYVVKAILGKKYNREMRKTLYLCQWSGDGGMTWEDEADLECPALLEEYDEKIKRKALERIDEHREIARRKFAQRRGTYNPVVSRREARRRQAELLKGVTGGGAVTGGQPETDRLMSLDIPALRQYLQTVTEFTPLHYELLLRLSEDDVSRGASADQLERLVDVPKEVVEEAGDCLICLDPLTNAPATLLPCSHFFHSECVRNWLKNEKVCPSCKREL